MPTDACATGTRSPTTVGTTNQQRDTSDLISTCLAFNDLITIVLIVLLVAAAVVSPFRSDSGNLCSNISGTVDSSDDTTLLLLLSLLSILYNDDDNDDDDDDDDIIDNDNRDDDDIIDNDNRDDDDDDDDDGLYSLIGLTSQ